MLKKYLLDDFILFIMNYRFSNGFFILFCLIFSFIISFSGCVEEKPIFQLFVDDNYNSNTPGWQVDHFRSIQEAINAANSNSTINVNDGIYNENLVITKKISLFGNNANSTIINGDGIKSNVVTISIDGCEMSGFTIQNSGQTGDIPEKESGLYLSSSNNSIYYNIFKNNTCGMVTKLSTDNILEKNLFIDNFYGIYLNHLSNNNRISENIYCNNEFGMRIKSSKFNIINKNIIAENRGGMYICCAAINNTIYSNMFCENVNWHVEDWCNNSWDNENIGNYWDNYQENSAGAFDNNSDLIVDKALILIAGVGGEQVINVDRYPLMFRPNIGNPFINKASISCVDTYFMCL